MFTWRVLFDLILEKFDSAFEHVISKTGHATMSEQLDFVVEFEHLRVLFLTKLVFILLTIGVKLLTVFLVVATIVFVLIKERVIVIVLAVEVWSLDQIVIIFAQLLH